MCHIKKLAESFSKENLVVFFRQKIASFQPEERDISYMFDNALDGRYEYIIKVGEASLGADEVIVILSKTNDCLTEKSGKKSQYDIAKRVLQNENIDAAFFVFYDQHGNFRFSFIRANYTGIRRDYTSFKRYTYFVSPQLTNKTFYKQVGECAFQNTEEVVQAFSVEPLNKEFYKEISKAFYKLVGGVVKIGNRNQEFSPSIVLPGISSDDRKTYQEFGVRLIGRIIFCWFLKTKKSRNGQPLIPEKWLSLTHCGEIKNYYHNILEKLFFEILNRKQDDRPDKLPDGHKNIPFLNGGLFEPNANDYYKPDSITGQSVYFNTLKIPDGWLESLFGTLEQYNFTIDENSIYDAEVSIDPEMLGTIFENLLAEIDPDTKENARKATGSFYTPREIVDYMVEQTLVQHIINKTGFDNEEKLLNLFREGIEPGFDQKLTEKILNALSEAKILDPACGSGAFPMGALHKILIALQKLDKDALWWKNKQLEKVDNALVRKQLEERLSKANTDYIRKLGVIQNSIYGVDIQPIASEISKLRCFLSLIIDENIDDNAPNRGILPLPNLEFKFVTCNTLIGLEENKLDFSETAELQNQLKRIRTRYLQSYGDEKDDLIKLFKEVQEKIFKKELKDGGHSKRATQLTSWDPFGHESCGWFETDWMFGIKQFDILIGNPPYGGKMSAEEKAFFKKNYYSAATIKNIRKGNTDTYVMFIEKGIRVLRPEGVLTYIVPISVTSNESNTSLHSFIKKSCKKSSYTNFAVRPKPIFLNAVVNTAIMQLTKNNSTNDMVKVYSTKMYRKSNSSSIEEILKKIKFREVTDFYMKGRYPKISLKIEESILKKILNQPMTIGDCLKENGKRIYYRFAGGRYFKVITNYPTGSSAESFLVFHQDIANSMGAILSSNLYFWFYQIVSDNLNMKKFEIESFGVPIDKLTNNTLKQLEKIYSKYLNDIEKNASVRQTKKYANIDSFKEYKIGRSKFIIDQFDDVIGPLYGLTDHEIKFIKNYEVQYRLSFDQDE